MATNNFSISSVNGTSPVFNRTGLLVLIVFSLIFLLPSVSQADGLFDFQMKLAEKGNAEAQFKVGEMYETGFGVKEDMAQAETWIVKAADQGHETAGFKLLYWDVEKNGETEANKVKLDELKAKAKQGNPQAEYYIGKMYANGVGLKQDSDKAIKWLNKAALVGVLAAEREMSAVRELKTKQDQELAKKRAADKKRAEQKARQDRERQAQLDAQRKLEAQKKAAAAAAAAAALQKQKQAEAANTEAAKQAKEIADKKALEKKQAEARKAEAERQALLKQQQEEENKRNAQFEADPCSGKSARFLSTCR